jgi:hypothetical protein
LHGGGSDGNFEWQHDGPLKDIVPTHRKGEGLVKHTRRERVEPSTNGVEDGHLSQGLGDTDEHDAHDDPGDQDGGGSTGRKGGSGTDEKTGTDGSSDLESCQRRAHGHVGEDSIHTAII